LTSSGTYAGCYDLLRALRGWTLADLGRMEEEERKEGGDGNGKSKSGENGNGAEKMESGEMEMEGDAEDDKGKDNAMDTTDNDAAGPLDYTTRELRLPIKQRIRNFAPPKLHVFGHIHEGYGISSDGETLFANASTCNLRYRPDQVPLVVDLVI
jgi:hypothetical protein